MCRNIRTLFHLDPPCTEDEIRDAALQFVRKVSGFTKPSQKNEPAFEAAVEQIAAATETLFASLETTTPPRDRELLAQKARERAAKRYGR